jgi:hypothetical protein
MVRKMSYIKMLPNFLFFGSVQFIKLSFFIFLFALSGCKEQTNKQTNEVIIPSKKEKVLRIKVPDKQLIDNSGDKSKYKSLYVVTALSNRDGYLNSYAEEMKNMNDDRAKIFKRNNKNWPHTRLRDEPEKRRRQVN